MFRFILPAIEGNHFYNRQIFIAYNYWGNKITLKKDCVWFTSLQVNSFGKSKFSCFSDVKLIQHCYIFSNYITKQWRKANHHRFMKTNVCFFVDNVKNKQ